MVFPTVMPGWDNTPRRLNMSNIYTNNSLESFRFWIREKIVTMQDSDLSPDKRLLFINAWNEWAEGSQIEPDVNTYKFSRLEAIRDN